MEENELVDDAADEAAFNEGAAQAEVKVKVDTATPTETPEPEKTPEPVAEVVAPKYVQITEDEFKDLRTKAALAEELKTTSEKSFGTAFGKIGGLERVINELKAQPNLGELSKDDFSELKDAFPELAEMTVAGLNRALGKLKGAPGASVDPAKVNDLVQQGIALKLQERELQQQKDAVAALDTDHADWREVKAKPEFKAWIEKQPQRVQKTYAKTWDADFLSDVFTSFKEAAKTAAAPTPPAPPATTRKDRLAAAVNPRGTGGHAPGPSEDDDFLAGFNQGRKG